MGILRQAEDKIGNIFKDAPALSPSSKETLVKVWPWLALIFGILQLSAAWGLWRLARWTSVFSDYANEFSRIYTGRTVGLEASDKFLIYLGIIILLVDAVILLMAFPELKKRARRGWELLFLGSLINVAYSVLTIFIHGRGFGTFIFSLIGSVIGFYLLFQVRDKYKPAKKS